MNNRYIVAKDFAEKIKSDKIDKIILYGSVARGDDKEGSDIDVLIISSYVDEIIDDIDMEVVHTIVNTNELVSAHLMSVEKFNKEKNYPFLTNVLKEGVIL